MSRSARRGLSCVMTSLVSLGLVLALTGCEQKPAGKPKAEPKAEKKAEKQTKAKAEEKVEPKAEKKAEKKAAPKPKKKAEKKKEQPKPAPKPEKKAEKKPAPKTEKKAKSAAKKPTPKPNFASPPEGAVVLFDGKSAKSFTTLDGKPCPWQVKDGALVCKPKSGSIRSKQAFGDQKLHIEFKPPHMPDAKKGSQARGNSGVYIQGRYEIQVLDSYDIGRPMKAGDCGALYSLIAPSVNVCLPPDEWQSFDITFHAPKFDKDGKMTKKGRLTIVHNGVTTIDNKEIPKVTPGGIDKDPKKDGPLMLQDHGNTVAYRNIWVVPIK